MTLQAWHTCIWGVSPILLCRSSQPLSGWMWSVTAQLFSGLSSDVRSSWSPGSGWASRDLRDLSRSHSCVVLAVCLGSFSFWKVNLRPTQVLSALEQVFNQGSLCTLLCSYFPRSWLASQSLPLLLPCFTVGMVTGFLQMWRLVFGPKNWKLHKSAFWKTPGRLSFTEWLPFGHSTIKAWLMECCRDGWHSGRFSTKELWSSVRVTIGFLVTSLTKALLPRLLSLAGRPALGRVLVVPNFFHLRIMEATVFFNAAVFTV